MSGFYADTFDFLTTLQANNHKAWFDENRDNYEHQVRGPALDFIEAFSYNLSRLSPHFVASPRKVGGSLKRIHRDTRFSKDKTPYKTNIGIHFRHVAGKDAHCPAYYLHLSNAGCFIGAGIWRPESKAISAIRDRIDRKGQQWQQIVDELPAKWQLVGDKLQRPPRGFNKEHPMLAEIKRKDFIVQQKLPKKTLLSAQLPDELFNEFKACSAMMQFLCAALDKPF